ncbi:hypothetical protein SDC9_90120 [bioreactor metagenome]|uniref:Uncharacterized protein n=1 Tax=bioreactor metagenome TaxID=1076179 RepID=A0A644ZRQ5_9ZZZZ
MEQDGELSVKLVYLTRWQNGTQRVPSALGGGSAAVVVAAAVVSATVPATVSVESVPAAAEEKNDDDEPPAGVVAIPRVKAHGFVTSLKSLCDSLCTGLQKGDLAIKIF